MNTRRTEFARQLSDVLDPRLSAFQRRAVVRALVDDWNSGTKDNYLQKFEVFVGWLLQRGYVLGSSIDRTHLLQFAVYLLEERQPKLKASSVAQYLAGIRRIASLL